MGDVEVHALRGVSLTVEQGSFTAIMGSSGSGKSTLMNVLGCLDRPTSGRCFLDGRDVSKLGANELAEVRNRSLGFVFQNFSLLPRTSAIENVELPLVYAGVPTRERRRAALAALERVGLGSRADPSRTSSPAGSSSASRSPTRSWNQPRIVLADEPTGALDSKTSLEIMALIQDLGRSGITVVLVTHEPDIAAYASRVIVVKDGLIQSDVRQEPLVAARPPRSPPDPPAHEPDPDAPHRGARAPAQQDALVLDDARRRDRRGRRDRDGRVRRGREGERRRAVRRDGLGPAHRHVGVVALGRRARRR